MVQEIPFPPNSRVVAYLRDSGGDAQELSVAQQEQVVRTWCTGHNLLLTTIFADVAAPGSSTIGRDQFQKLIAHFHDPECKETGLIIWKLSRFSRDMDDSAYYRSDLRRRGFVIHSLQDNIPDSSDGRIFESLHDWMNEKYLEELSVDVKRGLHHLVTNYQAIPGTPPRGFKREIMTIGKHRDGRIHQVSRWVPDPELWDKCKEAWRMRAQGIPFHVINRKLALFGSINSYTTFFTNRLYLGEMHYGNVVIKDYAEPMVTQEMWDMVQSYAHKNTKKENPMSGDDNRLHPRRAGSSFLLSGLAYCTRCGSLLNGDVIAFKNGRRLEYYHCRNSHNYLGCDARRISKPVIEAKVIESLREYVLDPEVVKERDKESALAQANDPQRIKKALTGAAARLANNTRRINNVTNRLADEDNPPESLVAKLHELETENKELVAENDRLKAMLNHETVFVRDPDQIRKMIDGFNWSMTQGTLDEKRDAIRSLVIKVSAERDGDMVRGIIQFINPTGEVGTDMPMNESHRRDTYHRHIGYSLEFTASLTPQPYDRP